MSDWQFQPAKDIGQDFQTRIRSADRESSIFSALTRLVWWTFAGIVMRLMHRYKVTGREHLPQKAPFVLIANHSSHLDVASLMLALPTRLRDRTHPLAAADHFFGEVPMATFTAFAINALPVDRTSGKGRETMETLRERLLTQPFGLVLFPEGTRSRTGEVGKFKAGIGQLVAGTSIPVVPCYIDGAFEAFPATAKFPRLKPVRLIIGPAQTFPEWEPTRENLQEIASRLQAAVMALGK